MFRPRIIPVLLLDKNHLVKSKKFKNYRYIGDPINAVRIFNELIVDELVFLDISATKNGQVISLDIIKNIGEEANMPFCVGGGITKLSQIKSILAAGAEKVIIGRHAVVNPDFIKNASIEFGTSAITVCIDVKKNLFKRQRVYSLNGSKASDLCPLKFAQLVEEKGAGEIIVQSIEKDGTMNGYDLSLIKLISENVTIPTVALGGAGTLEDFKKAYTYAHASGVAAGSLFVFYGKNKGVLLNYPEKGDINFTNEV